MGKPGVGKTHLANALGLEALKLGHRVLITHSNALLERLHAARADGSYLSVLCRICRYHLLVTDERGFRKLPEQSLDDFLRSSDVDMKPAQLSSPPTEIFRTGSKSSETP